MKHDVMKYIVFQCQSEGHPTRHVPVIFPDVMTHKDMAEMVSYVKVQPDGMGSRWWMWPKPVSAGFICDGVCSGYSESLGLKVHPDDSKICAGKNDGLGFTVREIKEKK